MPRLRTSTLLRVLAVALIPAAIATNAFGANFFSPVGTHDVANCSTLAGWAKDGDTTLPTQVHIYRGAPFPFGSIVTHVVADLFRPDLPFADKNHGFSIPTPQAFFTGCPEKVFIHAIDIDTNGNIVPGGNNILLNNTGKTILCGPIDPSCFPIPGPFPKDP
jgi:hypothetical protein